MVLLNRTREPLSEIEKTLDIVLQFHDNGIFINHHDNGKFLQLEAFQDIFYRQTDRQTERQTERQTVVQ